MRQIIEKIYDRTKIDQEEEEGVAAEAASEGTQSQHEPYRIYSNRDDLIALKQLYLTLATMNRILIPKE